MGFHPLDFGSVKITWTEDFRRIVHSHVLSHIVFSVQHYLFLVCVGTGVSFSCISSKFAFPSLKKVESVSQARIHIFSNLLFNKHPYPGAAAWTITSNVSLSIWERDLSCCRRFTYGIFTAAA